MGKPVSVEDVVIADWTERRWFMMPLSLTAMGGGLIDVDQALAPAQVGGSRKNA